jgi:hypothetical protein
MFKSKRFYSNLIIFISIFTLPWWVPLFLSIIAAWFYLYYEAIIVGLLLDLLYRSDLFVTFYGKHIPLFFTIILTVIVIVFRIIKKRVRFYS